MEEKMRNEYEIIEGLFYLLKKINEYLLFFHRIIIKFTPLCY